MTELVDAESEHVSFRSSEAILQATGDLPRGGNAVNVSINNSARFTDYNGQRTEIAAGYVISLESDEACEREARTLLPIADLAGAKED